MSASNGETRLSRSRAAQKLKEFDPKISYRALPETKEVEISITVNETWGVIALEALQFMDRIVRSVNQFSEKGFRDIRTEKTLADLEARYNVVRNRYFVLRAEGVKHRMAVHMLVTDRELPFHGRWTYADFNWCVKARSQNPSIRTLKKV